MAQMIRKQVYIEAHRGQLLKVLAKDLRVTGAELVRRGIDQTLLRRADFHRDPAPWRGVERSAFSHRLLT